MRKSLKDVSNTETHRQQVSIASRAPSKCTMKRDTPHGRQSGPGRDTEHTERGQHAEQRQRSARLAGHSGAATVEGSLLVSYKTERTRIYTKELES